MIELETSVLPVIASALQSGLCVKRYSTATARYAFGFISPAFVTMPWRS